MKLFIRVLAIFSIVLILFSIYVAVQPSYYEIQRKKVLKVPSPVVFNTINEYKTWMDWGPWKEEDPTIIASYPEITSGVGAGYSWTSEHDGSGRMETIALEENKSLEQKIYFDSRGESDVYWHLQDVEKGTDITWGMKGELDFMGKAYFMFMGGADKVFGKIFDTGLSNLDKYVHAQMDKHSITNIGIAEHGGGYFVHITAECAFDEMGGILDKILPEVLIYTIQNRYPRAGDIFTLYHKYDEENKRVEFSSCVPVKERVNPEGEIALAFMESGRYHKTRLQGAYKFSDKAWEKAFEFAKADGLTVVEDGKPFEVYTKGHTDSPNPADWETEIYLPIE